MNAFHLQGGEGGRERGREGGREVRTMVQKDTWGRWVGVMGESRLKNLNNIDRGNEMRDRMHRLEEL